MKVIQTEADFLSPLQHLMSFLNSKLSYVADIFEFESKGRTMFE